MSEENGKNGIKQKAILIFLSVFITWSVSLFTIHGTVKIHSHQISSIESSIQEIRTDIKSILKELRK